MRYMVVVEHGPTSWGAHVPDLPGCIAVADTRTEVLRLMREAINSHIDGLREDGLPVPRPSSEGEFVEVNVAYSHWRSTAMTTANLESKTIHERIARLERQNTWLRRAATVFMLLVAAFFMMGQASPKGRSIETDRLVLKDDSGVVRATLAVDHDGVGLRLYDERGNPRVHVAQVEKLGPFISFSSRTGKNLVILRGGASDLPGLHMFDTNGTERASLGLSATSGDIPTPGLTLDGLGSSATVLAIANLPMLTLTDAAGKKVTMHLKPAGPGLWAYDENGRATKGVQWVEP
jgi:predicted RNase H-like HicB family nuclease